MTEQEKQVVLDAPEDAVYHVSPINDLKEHILDGPGCACEPTLLVEPAGFIIVHNSYDGRELFEHDEPGVDQ